MDNFFVCVETRRNPKVVSHDLRVDIWLSPFFNSSNPLWRTVTAVVGWLPSVRKNNLKSSRAFSSLLQTAVMWKNRQTCPRASQLAYWLRSPYGNLFCDSGGRSDSRTKVSERRTCATEVVPDVRGFTTHGGQRVDMQRQ